MKLLRLTRRLSPAPRPALLALLIVLVGLLAPSAAVGLPLNGSYDAAAVPAAAATSTPSTPSIVASKVVNLRGGPGTNYPVVGSAAVGKPYQVTGRNKDGTWLELCCVNGKAAWVLRSLVTVNGSATSIPLAKSIPPPPAAKPAAAPAASKKGGPKWDLVADSAADFPGGSDHNWWSYLWTSGRNSFAWQDAQFGENSCYRDSGGLGMEICRDTIKADPRGDIGVQWKASRGGTYKFEWDSPWLKFYKHADFVSTQGKGAELPFSAVITGVIDWEMFFWVAGDSTPYHIKVFRLDESAGASAASQPVPAAGGNSEIGVLKQAAGVGLTVLSMQKTYQVDRWIDAAPGDIALIIDVEIVNTGRTSEPYNPLYFDVQDNTGAVWMSSVFAPEPDLPAGTLLRGEKVRGNVAFVVPQTARGFTILYKPIVFFGGYETVRVRLGD